jgi:uncharacterized protein with PIN domain
MTYVVCPHCEHEFTDNDMNGQVADLWAIAPKEQDAEAHCPKCYQQFWVRGTYTPRWNSAKTEDAL